MCKYEQSWMDLDRPLNLVERDEHLNYSLAKARSLRMCFTANAMPNSGWREVESFARDFGEYLKTNCPERLTRFSELVAEPGFPRGAVGTDGDPEEIMASVRLAVVDRVIEFVEELRDKVRKQLSNLVPASALSPDRSDGEVDFENGCSKYLPGLRWSKDLRSLFWNEEEYSLTASQAAILEVLIKASITGVRDVSSSYILEESGCSKSRVPDILKRSVLWKTLVVQGGTKGTLRLNLRSS